MSTGRDILLRMFGRPRGLLGRLGGVIMARTNARHAAWVIDLLEVRQDDRVLDVGFGPGVAVQLVAVSAQSVAGVDPSAEMLRQATKRNAEAIGNGRVDLRRGSADRLPFAAESFDKAMALNSMQVWPDASAGLREIWRVLKPGGRLALAFTTYSGQGREGVPETVAAAGFTDWRIVEAAKAFCIVATKPPLVMAREGGPFTTVAW
jgi:ubiquinone/menaquinone biosynthesis C-methylase UbiE